MFFLIDGSAILYRSFYGIAPLKTSSGQATQAVLGFLRSLKKIIKTFSPDHLLVAWDSPKSLRKEEFSQYKSNRLKIPDELLSQKIILEELLQTINIAQITKNGFEADDILYSICKKALEQKWSKQVIIASPDKDLLQLVDSSIAIFDPFKDKLFDTALVTETLGFPPSKIKFYHSLLGDSSDNIPGVTGIGKESARKLVNQFETLTDLYSQIENVEAKLKKKLLAGKEDALISEKLFTLRDIDDLDIDLNQANINLLDWNKGLATFEKLELKSMLPDKKISLSEQFKEEEEFCKKLNLTIIDSQKLLEKLISDITKHKIFAFDLETTGLSWLTDKVIGISFCFPTEEVFYIPLSYDSSQNQLNLLKDLNVFSQLKAVFENIEILKIAHNSKFDGHFLHYHGGINIFNNLFDTAIAARLSLPEWIKVGLKNLSLVFLNLKRKSFAELLKENGGNIALDKMARYAALDALQTYQLYKILVDKLNASPSLLKSFREIEIPLVPILLKMEERGILFNLDVAQQLTKVVEEKLEIVKNKIYAFLDNLEIDLDKKQLVKNINLNSPQQLQILLFDILGLPTAKKSGSGKYSTDVDVLEELGTQHPIPNLILEYRRLFKLKSTYLEGLTSHCEKPTGAIHTDYSQLMVSTGRLSSLDPNLQNIPQSSDQINIRNCFVPREGYYFLSADYSQIELRILAHITGDKQLTAAFEKGEDIHAKTACKIFSKEIQDITSTERDLAKKINFSVLYGLSAFSLSKDLKINVKKAQEYIDAFFASYPGVQKWMDTEIKLATQNGFISTIGGRQRWFNGLSDNNLLVAKAQQRAAINAIIQGSAAEIIKLAMIKSYNFLQNTQGKTLNTFMLLQVHDEILFECQGPENKDLLTQIKELMEQITEWQVPLIVNLKTGQTWGELVKV